MIQVLVNLYAGPGSGKTTAAAEAFALLKRRGISSEVAWEWVKGPAWDDAIPADQLYIFAKQHRAVARPWNGGARVVLTDSPLLLSLVYGSDMPGSFKALVRDVNAAYTQLNYFVKRVKPYSMRGRTQTEEEAKALDVVIKRMLDREQVSYREVECGAEIAHDVIEFLCAS